MAKWVPTKREVELIKLAASQESGPHVKVGALALEPGVRCNLEDEARNTAAWAIQAYPINVALFTDDENWDDTDLDQYGTWDQFRQGVALTEDGRAMVDFYIRSRFDPELCGNVTVYYADGKLTRIHGYPGEYPVA